MPAHLIESGRAALGGVHGERGLGYLDRLAAACPAFADCLQAYPYGTLYARPGLDLRDRQIATIAALTVLGDSAHELEIHVASSLRAGLTRDEIVEILLQMTAYAGFPRALAAFKAADAAFRLHAAEAGAAAESQPAPEEAGEAG